MEDCDLCGNSAFREGYCETLPEQKAFNTAPDYPGYLQSQSGADVGNDEAQLEGLVQTITDQVMTAMR